MKSFGFLLNQFLIDQSPINILFAIVLTYCGGVLSSFTPCVYPMIPVTIGILTRQGKSFIPTFFYVLGMGLIYATLGIIAVMSGKIFGSLTQRYEWYLGLGIFLTIMSLFMMDVITLPTKAFSFFSGKNSQGHNLQSFLVGISSGMVSAPCTTPVLTAVLVFVMQTKSFLLGFILMFIFAVGLNSVLILLGFTANRFLPLRSGHWMEKIKVFGALCILGYAEYLLFKAGIMKVYYE